MVRCTTSTPNLEVEWLSAVMSSAPGSGENVIDAALFHWTSLGSSLGQCDVTYSINIVYQEML